MTVTVSTTDADVPRGTPARLSATQKREAAMSLRAMLNDHGGPDCLKLLLAWLENQPAPKPRKPRKPKASVQLEFAPDPAAALVLADVPPAEVPPPPVELEPPPEPVPAPVLAPAPEPAPEPEPLPVIEIPPGNYAVIKTGDVTILL